MIKATINLSRIDSKRVRYDDNGDELLDIVIIPTPNSKHGDHIIAESVSRSERMANVRGNILGNGTNVVRR